MLYWSRFSAQLFFLKSKLKWFQFQHLFWPVKILGVLGLFFHHFPRFFSAVTADPSRISWQKEEQITSWKIGVGRWFAGRSFFEKGFNMAGAMVASEGVYLRTCGACTCNDYAGRHSQPRPLSLFLRNILIWFSIFFWCRDTNTF